MSETKSCLSDASKPMFFSQKMNNHMLGFGYRFILLGEMELKKEQL